MKRAPGGGGRPLLKAGLVALVATLFGFGLVGAAFVAWTVAGEAADGSTDVTERYATVFAGAILLGVFPVDLIGPGWARLVLGVVIGTGAGVVSARMHPRSTTGLLGAAVAAGAVRALIPGRAGSSPLDMATAASTDRLAVLLMAVGVAGLVAVEVVQWMVDPTWRPDRMVRQLGVVVVVEFVVIAVWTGPMFRALPPWVALAGFLVIVATGAGARLPMVAVAATTVWVLTATATAVVALVSLGFGFNPVSIDVVVALVGGFVAARTPAAHAPTPDPSATGTAPSGGSS